MRFTLVIALILSGCAPLPQTPFVIERGGTLPAEDYARLASVAGARTTTMHNVVRRRDDPVLLVPLPIYAYALRPSFDPKRITQLEIGRFVGDAGQPGEVAAELPAKLAERLSSSGLPATVVSSGSPGAFVLSGTVTRAGDVGIVGDRTTIGTQVEATVSRDNTIVGAMQINAVGKAGDPSRPLVGLILSAVEGSRASIVSRRIDEIFGQIRAGEPEGASIETVQGYMWMGARTGTN